MSHELRFERLFDAAPEEVFDALIDPEGLEEMYGRDEPGWTVESEGEVRVGARGACGSVPRRTSRTASRTRTRLSTARGVLTKNPRHRLAHRLHDAAERGDSRADPPVLLAAEVSTAYLGAGGHLLGGEPTLFPEFPKASTDTTNPGTTA